MNKQFVGQKKMQNLAETKDIMLDKIGHNISISGIKARERGRSFTETE